MTFTGPLSGWKSFKTAPVKQLIEAQQIFAGTDIPWASFHTFRREAGTVALKKQAEETEDEEKPDELDETLTGMDHIPYTPQNEEEFFAQIEQWNDEDEFICCIQALNAIPKDWHSYRTAYAPAQALENYAVLGDHQEEPPTTEPPPIV